MKSNRPKIKYFDFYGLRKDKYKFLESHDVKDTKWQDLELKEPYYWFVPKNAKGEEKYQKFLSVQQIFIQYKRCVVTSRDDFVISSKLDELKRNIDLFLNPGMDNEIIKSSLNLKDGKKWKIGKAREKLLKTGAKENLFVDYLYRPFDKRFIYYEDALLERSRKEMMRNMLRPNIALLLMRQVYWSKPYSHFLVTNSITDSRVFISNRGAADIFPLYLYEPHKKFIFKGQKHLDITGIQKGLDEKERDKKSNVKDEIIEKLSDTYKKQIVPEQVFYYIYGVLYSPIYRKKYNEFLKIDFPKIPFTKSKELFNKISEIGKGLIDLHLLKSPKLEKVIAKFPVSTGNILKDNRVEKREYNEKKKRIYINEKQYFEKIEPEVWNYHIGGYQVLDKWLKDRIGRKLSPENVSHYLKIITAIKHTIDLQKEIDKIYPEVEKSLIKI